MGSAGPSPEAKPHRLRDWSAIVAAPGAAALLAACASDGAVLLAGVPAPAVCVAVAFAIQWIAFLFAWTFRSERFFDLVGSLSFIALATLALVASQKLDVRGFVIALLVIAWAVRLGAFLTLRIHRAGFDRRFSDIKASFSTFLMTWTLQGLWVSISFGAGLAAILASSWVPASGFLATGVVLWGVGFAVECVADWQKRRFRADPNNAGRFIETGLWAWCRHPNYLGEILLWTGIAVAAWPALSGWAHVTLISPVFVWLLLTRISGLPMLEAAAERRWGGNPDYLAYRSRTPALVPSPRGWRRLRTRRQD